MRSVVKIVGAAAVVAAAGIIVSEAAAQSRPLSTRGHTATQIGGSYNEEGRYEGGYWIDIHYGRPILRGRQGIFGEGEEFGQRIYAGAPVWRVGADQTTTFTTEVDLLIGGQRLNAGEYTMFADLADPTAWTLIFSTWGVKQTFTEDNPNALWGAYGYDDSKDVLRTAMSVETVEYSMDQLQIGFVGMTSPGGAMYFLWDNQLASVPVELAN
ncbi:MAG: DUF2911 domain-containing protein [Acidobacteriota bacterium]|nr:DUF2911 domain-containing protein [Acidobacteriota bacterium]